MGQLRRPAKSDSTTGRGGGGGGGTEMDERDAAAADDDDDNDNGAGCSNADGGDQEEEFLAEEEEEEFLEEEEDFQLFVLSQDQVDGYLREGVLVVPDVLSPKELRLALRGMKSSLRRRLIRNNNIEGKEDDASMANSFDFLDELSLDSSSSSSSFSTTTNSKIDLDAVRKFRDELSSTNGSGGVLDVFWDDWKLRLVAHNPRLWQATNQLWKAVYDGGDDDGDGNVRRDEDDWRYHPYGNDSGRETTIDFDRGYCYIDRVGYRLPTSVSDEWGDMLYEHHDRQQQKQKDQHENVQQSKNENRTSSNQKSKRKKKKFRSVQRSLTPHLDCCPDNLWGKIAGGDGDGENSNGDFFENNSTATRPPQKWRPIQCFVALTDTLNKNEGGFECVPGFHREFHDWAKNRRRKNGHQSTPGPPSPSLCVGEYTHIRPTEERFIMDRVQHIPIKAGSAVFWDIRIPHANSYLNSTRRTRQVVYCSFLPDIELNRSYVQNQLSAYRHNRPIRDQWNHIPTAATVATATSHENDKDKNKNENHKDTGGEGTNSAKKKNDHQDHQNCSIKPATVAFTDLGQKLMGMKPW